MLRTVNSKKTLSDELQRVAVRVAAPPLNLHAQNTSAAQPGASSSFLSELFANVVAEAGDKDKLDEMCDWYEVNGGSGPSRAMVWTQNSSVYAGFVGDEGQASGSGGVGSCVVM